MNKSLASRAAALVPLLALLATVGCGQKPAPPAFTAPTPLTHRFFPIATGVHAVDCAVCHQNFSSFKQFDCLTCHVVPPTAAVHTTTPTYKYDSPSCLSCHRDPAAHPYDHKPAGACASCHAEGAFYAALPVAGFKHGAIGGVDCRNCHSAATWLSVVAPPGVVSDPAASVAVNSLIPRYSGTSIAALTPQAEALPMGMDHATALVNTAGLACSTCHSDANAGAFFPGQLHSSLANLSQPAPSGCVDCHAGSAPTGFVGPIAANPPRTPASGEMKHDAVAWSAGRPTATRLVTADCGVCHLSPTSSLAANWATAVTGTSPAQYHASLGAAQPTSCVDCHANSRPLGPLAAPGAVLKAGLTFDHASPAASADCAGCHAGSTAAWSGGVFHKAGSANPTTCLPCHDGQRPTSASGWTSATYAARPFDYGTNDAGITHGDGQDCALCHTGPGTGGAWGGAQSFVGGHFSHGPATVAKATCIACHMSQRPDLVIGRPQATTLLGIDHFATATGDCIGCHQATIASGNYLRYYGSGGTLPGGDWQGGQGYPGDRLVSAPNRFVTVTEISLVRATPGGLVTGMTTVQDTLYNAMLHTSAQVPAAMAPGPAGGENWGTCWHCHAHDAAGSVTSYADAVFHAALSTYAANVGGPVNPQPQPTRCLDCHAQMRPPAIVERAGSNLQPMDHDAVFTGTVTIAGQAVTGVAGLDCATCHQDPGGVWTDGNFHLKTGAQGRPGDPVPADCTACHYPLMADPVRADVASGVLFDMSHRSVQLTFQSCPSCHASALGGSTAAPYLPTAWRPGAFHGSVPAQPTGCIDCHAVSEPAAGAPTQSTWSYTLALGGTATNGRQWMNHGAAPVVGADCATCHAADAKPAGSTWSQSTEFHVAMPGPGSCQGCHGTSNGGGTAIGTNNNLPAGLTDSNTLTTASINALTGVPATAHDQITHADLNVTGHDCRFCHTQAGRSATPGVAGAEWAQARFHASFSAATPLVMNGSTGRCSNCHMNVMPIASYPAKDHTGLTSAAGTQDCSSCHAWPGTGGTGKPNWLGATSMPQFISVGGFTIPAPPAGTPTTQTGIANLPHPTVTVGMLCSTCHAAGNLGGRKARGYDHLSALINANCSACHEAGSDLVATPWNGATSEASGAGDTRPFTLTSVVAQKGGIGGDTCTVTAKNHFYPVQCGQCHAVPAGTGAVTTGAAYAAAWYFPHKTTKMTNPGTCNLCHTGPSCPK